MGKIFPTWGTPQEKKKKKTTLCNHLHSFWGRELHVQNLVLTLSASHLFVKLKKYLAQNLYSELNKFILDLILANWYVNMP